MSVATTRFKTLLQREWLQHRIGWLGVMLAPLVITLLSLPFTQGGPSRGDIETALPGHLSAATLAALVAWGVTVLAVVGLTLLAQLFQMSGLARRDAQDRSLEFWMSLPGSHSEHLGATLLAHTLGVFLLAVGVGLLSGAVIATAVVIKGFGFAELGAVQWGQVLTYLLPGLARLLGGLPMFVLWLSPVILLTMLASAWLKRWGVPLVVIGTVLLANLPATREPVRAWLEALSERISGAFFLGNPEQAREAGFGALVETHRLSEVSGFWRVVGTDLGNQLGHLATPMFLSVAVISVLCFAGLVYRRKHHL